MRFMPIMILGNVGIRPVNVRSLENENSVMVSATGVRRRVLPQARPSKFAAMTEQIADHDHIYPPAF